MQADRSSRQLVGRQTRGRDGILLRCGAVVLTVLVFSGCKDAKWPKLPPLKPLPRLLPSPADSNEAPPPIASRPAYVPTPMEAVQAAASPDAGPRRALVLQSIDFRILRIRAPMGTFSKSDKVWNAMDEEVVPAPTQQLLRKNGLRMGLGKAENWPQLKAILDAEKVEVVDRHRAVYNGLPLILDLERPAREQTMFLYRADGTMAGATFPRSTNVLRIEYAISTTESNTVIVDVMPEIRLIPVDTAPAFDLNWPEPPPLEPPSRPFRELSCRLTVKLGQFLAVGPSAAVQKGYVPGSLLLCDEVDGHRFEALYVITPKVVSANGDAGAAKPK